MADWSDPYSAELRRHFENPVHAGELSAAYTQRVVAEASESLNGACVQLAIGVRDGIVEACRFRAFGCPHLIAAAEWYCGTVEQRPTSELACFDATACRDALKIPLEKIGRILLLEDAIRLLVDNLAVDTKSARKL